MVSVPEPALLSWVTAGLCLRGFGPGF